MTQYFEELSLDTLANMTVILDVDGTLLADGASVLTASSRDAVARLAAQSQVYLCSNARASTRLDALAVGIPVQIIRSPYKKPDPRVLLGVADRGSMVVVGDKFLTDGLLAAQTKVPFLKVRTISDGKERMFVRIAYLFDRLVGPPLYFLARLFS